VVPLPQLLTSEVANGGGERTHAPRDETEPLTADLRRLHITVSRQLLKKIEVAQAGLGHVVPGASMEQVLEAAVDLLLEKQARARGLVKRPRAASSLSPTVSPNPNPSPSQSQSPNRSPSPSSTTAPASTPTEPPPHRREGPRAAIPAAVRRAVWVRDQGRCQWPLDSGGCCGSTHRLELDHVVPWARGGETTVENLRLTCSRHNLVAARHAFGERQMGRYRTG
jgi:hypothetical protein